MKQLIIISISVISFFIVLSMITYSPPYSPPKPLNSSNINYEKAWRIKGGIPFESRSQKNMGKTFNVTLIKNKKLSVVDKAKPNPTNNYETIDLKTPYIRWAK